METISLRAQARAKTGTGYGHRLRNQGKIPAVVYGKGSDNLLVQMDAKDLQALVHGKGRNSLIELNIEGSQAGKKTTVLLRDMQKDPIRGEVLHADFFQVSMGEKIHADAPIHLLGDSAGVRAGGIIQQQVRELSVECLPADIPEAINIDITDLAIGHSLTVADLALPEGVKVAADETTVIVSCLAPKMIDEAPDTTPEQPTEIHENAPSGGEV